MSARQLDGRAEAEKILTSLKRKIARRRLRLTLATILVGRRFDSLLYTKLKSQAAARIGIKTERYQLSPSTSQAKLRKLIHRLNRRQTINGILLQLPLPRHLDTDRLVRAIAPKKDADGFRSRSKVIPPTVAAVLHLVKLARPLARAAVAILGRDSVFTRELKQRLASRGFKATLYRATHRIPGATKNASVVITALGRGPRLTANHIKDGAVIIDVGIRRLTGKTLGDVAPSAWTTAAAISPVPGGVGPLTVAYLLYNTYHLALLK
ncbi:MAG: bifunctional 5,10-methylenetetrahydrofolate dehydrogenase/5,10-methenyltetrahydrofolate cyclohydrolase [Candidatus Kerfeldbacteria bacterium]|nr:bifunctional 5,10-methylenetetrahydrofolate dehydrogenase/5,10-methenyltetrahydrofolate cyclohydrolase [Candidatus Kerfeldbacteria bacterium]